MDAQAQEVNALTDWLLSDEQRATAWLEGSGGAKLRRDSPRSYAELAAAAMDDLENVIDLESLEHINMDLPRTATVHPRFELASECSELDRADRTPLELSQWLVTALPPEQSLVLPWPGAELYSYSRS